jgi:hypothetical protein
MKVQKFNARKTGRPNIFRVSRKKDFLNMSVGRRRAKYSFAPPSKSRKKDEAQKTRLSWLKGWTHHGLAGQTRARLNQQTHELQVRDDGKWISCDAECLVFFTHATGVREYNLG